MDRKGFSITIPQIILGVVSMFIAMLGIRIVNPVIVMVLGLWDTGVNKTVITIAVYLVIVFVIYIIVYGTIMGKAPALLGKQDQNEQEVYN